MGEHSEDFSAEGLSSSSGVCHSTCLKPGCEHSCACWKDEDVEAVISCGKDEDEDDLVVEEIGMALTEVMHANDDKEGPGLDEDSDDDICDDTIVSLESDSTDDSVDVDFEVGILPAFPCGDASESSINNSVAGNSSVNVGFKFTLKLDSFILSICLWLDI